MPRKTGERKTKQENRVVYFFVYRKGREIDIIHNVTRMDYHTEVETVAGPTGVTGSQGIFCNTIDEAFLVEKNFDALMDDELTPGDFIPNRSPIPDDKPLDIEEKMIHNGIRLGDELVIIEDEIADGSETPPG